MMKTRLMVLLVVVSCQLCLFGGIGSVYAETAFEGTKSESRGVDKYTFTVDGRGAWVLVPKKPRDDRAWVLRARFPDYDTRVDGILLEKGFHIAHIGVGGLFGAPEAVKVWDAFYKEMTEKYGLSKKPVLEGVSRGGLIVYNWAALNPDKVSAIYCLVPVCTVASWPAGTGKGAESTGDWAQCQKAYGMSADELLSAKQPIDKLAPLAKSKVPIVHVCGKSDGLVPYEENTKILAERYEALGGNIKVFLQGGGHKVKARDVQTVADFIIASQKKVSKKLAIPPHGNLPSWNRESWKMSDWAGCLGKANSYQYALRSERDRSPQETHGPEQNSEETGTRNSLVPPFLSTVTFRLRIKGAHS